MTHAGLASTRWSDASEPRIVSCAARLRRSTPTETVRETFAFVRDAIAHSCDVATDVVPLAASAVLESGTGLCFAKSHLLAALLRASSIPTALGYVRLRDPRAASGFCLHGFDVVELPGHGLVRVDARGDNATVSTTFDPPRESLAYWPAAEGEAFLDGAFVEPVAAVVDAYARARTLRELLADLPDLRV